MKHILLREGRLPSLLLFLGIFLYFLFLYPSHLHDLEQKQLFLFTGDYLINTLLLPAGFAHYIERFLIQFFLFPIAGAFLMAALLVGLQRMLRMVLHRFVETPLADPLTYIAPLYYWYLMGAEHTLPVGVIAALWVLVVFWGWSYLRSSLGRIITAFLCLPLLYFTAGGTVVIFLLFVSLWEETRKEISIVPRGAFYFFLWAFGVALPALTQQLGSQYPLNELWIGIRFYRYPNKFTDRLLLFWVTIGILPWVARLVTPREMGVSRYKRTVQRKQKILWGVLIVGGIAALYHSTNPAIETLFSYDRNVRYERWDAIEREARRRNPDFPLTIAALNLALSEKGELADKMFRYYQNGIDGLFPEEKGDFLYSFMTSEIYFRLGFLQTAKRYAFEAMESQPDFQKSSRSYCRLAETHLLLGEEVLADKYLTALEKTLFYRSWARELRALMQDKARLARHPRYGLLLKLSVSQDVLYRKEKSELQMLLMMEENPGHRKLFEYIMAAYLLEGDFKRFVRDFPLGSPQNYHPLPRSYQEAITFLQISQKKEVQQMPYPVSDEILQQALFFAQTITNTVNAQAILRDKFQKSYWYYISF